MKTLMLRDPIGMMSAVCLAPEGAAAGATAGSDTTAAPAAARPTAVARQTFSTEQIAEIRKLRAEKVEDGERAGSPVWSHAKLAEKFGTKAGTISQIVRNRTYKDSNYTPVNDGT